MPQRKGWAQFLLGLDADFYDRSIGRVAGSAPMPTRHVLDFLGSILASSGLAPNGAEPPR